MAESPALTPAEVDTPIEILHSDFEVVGNVPNQQNIWDSALVDKQGWNVTALFDEDQTITTAKVTSTNGEAPEDTTSQAVLELVLPTLQIVYNDYRAKFDNDSTAVAMRIVEEICEQDYNLYVSDLENRFPHTDLDKAFYLAILGPQTKYWQKDFTIPKGTDNESKIPYLVEQIAHDSTAEAVTESGNICRLDDSTVHANPGFDPEAAGKRRIIMGFVPLRPADAP